jgi:hypothetical protein
MFTASQSANAFKLSSDNERRRRGQELERGGLSPDSLQYKDAMQKFENQVRLGGTQAFNTGYTRGVQGGMQGLTAARNIHTDPNFASSAAGIASVNANQANISQAEWGARNQSARSLGKLFFPADTEEELDRAYRLSQQQQR